MNEKNRPLDAELSALLEGRLSPAAADEVRRRLDYESGLLDAEITDYLQHYGSNRLQLEPAPADLRHRLRAIPGLASRQRTVIWKWGMAVSSAVLVIAVSIAFLHVPAGETPTPAEAAQARADLVVAFSYLQQVTNRSGHYMKSEIGQATQNAIVNGIFLGIRSDQHKG